MALPDIDFDSMSMEERVELMDKLLISMRAAPEQFRLSPEQEAELHRRVREVESGEVVPIPWEQIRDEAEHDLS